MHVKLNYSKEWTCDLKKKVFLYRLWNYGISSCQTKKEKMAETFTWSSFNPGDYNMQEKKVVFSLHRGLVLNNKGTVTSPVLSDHAFLSCSPGHVLLLVPELLQITGSPFHHRSRAAVPSRNLLCIWIQEVLLIESTAHDFTIKLHTAKKGWHSTLTQKQA